MNTNIDISSALSHVAEALHGNMAASVFWPVLETCVGTLFGQRLFTVLVYDAEQRKLARIYSNRLDFNPVGGIKRVTNSRWSEQVLDQGDLFIGSTAADIESVFSDHAVLHANGCHSVLNIPIRQAGRTIGTLNLLDGERAYDDADRGLALVIAQLCVTPLSGALEWLRGLPVQEHMEQV